MIAKQIIDIATAEIGYTELPPNSNRTKYGAWYGLDGQPWCMMFVQWCFAQAGSPLPYKTASCSALERWYRANKPDAVHTTPEPGDIVIYSFGHTGIVESVQGDSITVIEGNTSADYNGSQNNGGGVYKRVRKTKLATAFIRPDYEEDKNMDVERFKELWMEMRAELQDDDASSWSQEARDWATSNGIIQGGENDNYMWEDMLTREQMAVIMYRFAQLMGKA